MNKDQRKKNKLISVPLTIERVRSYKNNDDSKIS